jgi:TonB family protein
VAVVLRDEVNAMLVKIRNLFSLSSALCLAVNLFSLSASVASAAPSNMTLEHLKNGSFQITDLGCGYEEVHLINGKGKSGHCQVVLGRVVFGDFDGDGKLDAVAHAAFRFDGGDWMQELIFVEDGGNKLLQLAEYSLDDREELKNIEIKDKRITIESTVADAAHPDTKINKITKIKVSRDRSGQTTLKASEYKQDKLTKELKPIFDLNPYLAEVEDRIARSWQPSNRDRSEHVTVSFTIAENGEVNDLRINDSSEEATADEAAIDAVEQAAPFAPLPAAAGKQVLVSLEFDGTVALSRRHTVQ